MLHWYGNHVNFCINPYDLQINIDKDDKRYYLFVTWNYIFYFNRKVFLQSSPKEGHDANSTIWCICFLHYYGNIMYLYANTVDFTINLLK